MGLDVGTFTVKYLPRPARIAEDFASYLAGECVCTGEGNAFGWFMQEELLEEAESYAESKGLSSEQLDEITTWIKSLPAEDNELQLTFNW